MPGADRAFPRAAPEMRNGIDPLDDIGCPAAGPDLPVAGGRAGSEIPGSAGSFDRAFPAWRIGRFHRARDRAPSGSGAGSARGDRKQGGASGTIGTAEVARAKPDGYTLLLVFDSHAANAHLYKGLKYDTFESFEYVSLLVTAPRSTPSMFPTKAAVRCSPTCWAGRSTS